MTFYVVKWEDKHFVYSESEKRGLSLVGDSFDYQQYDHSHDDALALLRAEIQRLEDILERKRKGMPTPNQLAFFFRNKISIPLTLTWGEASDTIDDWLAKEKKRKLQAQAERFNGFTVGMRVFQLSPVYPNGKREIYTGEITKLTTNNKGDNYAYVKWDQDLVYGGISRTGIKTLYKTQQEVDARIQAEFRSQERLRQYTNQFIKGTRVRHPMLGEGVIDVESREGSPVYILFDSGHKGWYTLEFGHLQKLPASESEADVT